MILNPNINPLVTDRFCTSKVIAKNEIMMPLWLFSILIVVQSFLLNCPAKADMLLDVKARETKKIYRDFQFYWGAHLVPGQDRPEPDGLVDLGSSWTDQNFVGNRSFPSQGKATYFKTIGKLKPYPEGYQIAVRMAFSAVKLFIFPVNDPSKSVSLNIGNPQDPIAESNAAGFAIFFPAPSGNDP